MCRPYTSATINDVTLDIGFGSALQRLTLLIHLLVAVGILALSNLSHGMADDKANPPRLVLKERPRPVAPPKTSPLGTQKKKAGGKTATTSKRPLAPTKASRKVSKTHRHKAYCVLDASTGGVVSSDNGTRRLCPASLTKMLTLYIVFEHLASGALKLTDTVTITKNAASKPPCKIWLKPGEKVVLKQLLMATIVRSANDAATALGEHVAGSEEKFVKLMNQRAKTLGLHHSHFTNPTGLHNPRLQSTACDIALLAHALYRDFPQYYHLFSTKNFRYRKTAYTSTNKLLNKYRGLDGIKTGYTSHAGFNLATSARRGDHRLIVVFMGADTAAERERRIVALLDQGFDRLAGREKHHHLVHRPLPTLKRRPW